MRIHFLKFKSDRTSTGQSFVELALTLPVVILLLAGLVEVGFVMFAYLTVLDLTREAARFASGRDYRINPSEAMNICDDDVLNYYADTSCFFTDTGFNPYTTFQASNFDDVAISVFTINDNEVSNRWPGAPDTDGVWSLFSDNWKKDCNGVALSPAPAPFITNAAIQAMFVPDAPNDRGLVMVEGYFCHHLLLNLPFISQIVPSPFRIHAYTIMPAADAIPTPTPIP